MKAPLLETLNVVEVPRNHETIPQDRIKVRLEDTPLSLISVSGISGAGKSRLLALLEDSDFFGPKGTLILPDGSIDPHGRPVKIIPNETLGMDHFLTGANIGIPENSKKFYNLLFNYPQLKQLITNILLSKKLSLEDSFFLEDLYARKYTLEGHKIRNAQMILNTNKFKNPIVMEGIGANNFTAQILEELCVEYRTKLFQHITIADAPDLAFFSRIMQRSTKDGEIDIEEVKKYMIMYLKEFPYQLQDILSQMERLKDYIGYYTVNPEKDEKRMNELKKIYTILQDTLATILSSEIIVGKELQNIQRRFMEILHARLEQFSSQSQ